MVPVEPDLWTKPAFDGVVDDGYLYGRGALDMKELGAMELMTMVWLKRLSVPLDRDIVLLAQHFVELFAKEFKRPVRGISRAAEDALLVYSWPGNVRELRNLVERAVLLAEGDTLEPSDFESMRPLSSSTPSIISDGPGGVALPAGGVNLEDVERSLVVMALERTNGNQTRAAALLGLHRDQIRYRIEKFGLTAKKD